MGAYAPPLSPFPPVQNLIGLRGGANVCVDRSAGAAVFIRAIRLIRGLCLSEYGPDETRLQARLEIAVPFFFINKLSVLMNRIWIF